MHKFNRIRQVAPMSLTGGHVAVTCRITLNHPSTATMRLMANYFDHLLSLDTPNYTVAQIAKRFEPSTVLWAFRTIQPSSFVYKHTTIAYKTRNKWPDRISDRNGSWTLWNSLPRTSRRSNRLKRLLIFRMHSLFHDTIVETTVAATVSQIYSPWCIELRLNAQVKLVHGIVSSTLICIQKGYIT